MGKLLNKSKEFVVDDEKTDIVVKGNSSLSADVLDLEGVFIETLKRNNRKIREDRARAIGEDTQIAYRRAIEDIELSIKKMIRERENMLDLSPTDAQSLILAIDFDTDEYVKKDIEIGFRIRNAEKKYKIAKRQYNTLFGGA